MENKGPIFILYVSSQEKSRNFYRKVLGEEPVLDVPGMTEFRLSGGALLGLMPETGIAKIICPPSRDPAGGNGIPRCELYLYAEDPVEVLDRALASGATMISPLEKRTWGDQVAYCSDPDGHILAFARPESP